MSESPPKQLPPYGLRIPPDLKDSLQSAAKGNNRSMHAEIIDRLEKSFDESLGINREWMTNMLRQSLETAAEEIIRSQGPVERGEPSEEVKILMKGLARRLPNTRLDLIRELAEELARRRRTNRVAFD